MTHIPQFPTEKSVQTGRIPYFDSLRAIAVVAVVVLHSAAPGIYSLEIGSHDWNWHNVIDSLVRFCVPVFFMISGALFLTPSRVVTISKIFKNSIPRIAVPFLVWSLFFAVFSTFSSEGDGQLGSFLTRLGTGHYHLWYLIALAGLYVATPILRAIVIDRTATVYFVALAIPFALILPLIPRVGPAGNVLMYWEHTMQLNLILGYTVFFITGYLLASLEFNATWLRVIATAGALGAIVTAVGTYYLSKNSGVLNLSLYDYRTLNVYLAAVAVFLLVKAWHSGKKPRHVNRITQVLARHSFGIYLVHPFFQDLFRMLGFTGDALNPAIGIPLLAAAITLLSLVSAAILSRIPVIGKWIV